VYSPVFKVVKLLNFSEATTLGELGVQRRVTACYGKTRNCNMVLPFYVYTLWVNSVTIISN